MKCPACGSRKSSGFITVSGYEILRCKSCSLAFTKTNRRVLQHVNTVTYNAEYLLDYKERQSKFYTRFRMLLQQINAYKKSGRLADIGCGSGYFLAYLKQYAGQNWKLSGVEPNTVLRKAAGSATGISVRNGTMSALPYTDEALDVITCLDVLEHSPQLEKNIIEFHRVLKPGSILLVQSPNYDSLMAKLTRAKWDWWSPPDHVLHFTPAFLNKFIESQGFSVLRTFTYEDSYDFQRNIRGILPKGKMVSGIFHIVSPLLWFAEQIAGRLDKGGLVVIIAQK